MENEGGQKWIENEDWSGRILRNKDFTQVAFKNVCFDGADLTGSCFHNALLDGCSLRNALLKDADLTGTSLRGADLEGADICGANLWCAVLEKANLTDVRSDEATRFFRLYCPEKGAFMGYKKCCDDRIVELLIPADAKRTSATRNSCRCSKAKVLIIKNFDCTQYYDEAWSLVDETFVYRRGCEVKVPDFDEDRWNDSTTGIHFWMTREEAMKY